MMPSIDIDPTKLIDKLFKIRKLEYNFYQIDHPSVKGQLRLIAIPINIMEVPKELLPKDIPATDFPVFFFGTQAIVTFSNQGPKKTPQKVQLTQEILQKAKKEDITSFVIDQPSEPWNEFIIQGNPPLLFKTRTILTKLEWLIDHTDIFGAPILNANHNTTHSVSQAQTGESGLR